MDTLWKEFVLHLTSSSMFYRGRKWDRPHYKNIIFQLRLFVFCLFPTRYNGEAHYLLFFLLTFLFFFFFSPLFGSLCGRFQGRNSFHEFSTRNPRQRYKCGNVYQFTKPNELKVGERVVTSGFDSSPYWFRWKT